MNNNFGKFLTKLRKEKKITQLELSKDLYVSDKTVSRWENGYIPDIETVFIIAKYFNVSVEELYNGKRKKKNIKFLLFILSVILLFVSIVIWYYKYDFYDVTLTTNEFYIMDGYYLQRNNNYSFKLGNIKFKNNINTKYLYLILYENNKVLYSGFYSNIEINNKGILDKNSIYIKLIDETNNINGIYKIDFSKYTNVYNSGNKNIDDFINNNYLKLDNDVYFKDYDNYKIYFNISSKVYNRVIEDNGYIEYINYYYNGNILNYQKYYNDSLIEEFNYYLLKDNYECLLGRCTSYKYIYNLIKDDIELFS